MARKRGLIFGVGVNDADYATQQKVSKVVSVCPYYRKWSNMLERCYSKAYQSKQPTYIGCCVCAEWLTFSNFKSWMEAQDWQGKEIDKDIVGNGKLYSPENCVFVEKRVNVLFGAQNRFYRTGVAGLHFNKRENKYQVRVASMQVGYFSVKADAEDALLKAKAIYAAQIAIEQTSDLIKRAIYDKFILPAMHLLMPGERHAKTWEQDINEAIASLERAKELRG